MYQPPESRKRSGLPNLLYNQTWVFLHLMGFGMRLETKFLQFKLNKNKKSGLFIVGSPVKDEKEKGGKEI